MSAAASTLNRANAAATSALQAATAAMSGLRDRAVDSAELLRGGKTVEIQHNGSVYRLQATRLGKLILTK
ncbi:hemin uptake protein HemP [Xylophilus sp.]|uniref:hemin uptake protein HemP n=1 Tax=Xylophilus sp. TaxID=2653893 RepID=UPI0013BB9193|nr:hemin uptake protein HemP [Xylophilus sp.]KAF1044633.1 MAG: hypothetical protein GAK38_03468 [Xylophilus sp.]